MRFFFYKFVKEIYKKIFFSVIFSKNFNWQVIPSWVIISYKIIKFVSVFTKFVTKNVLYKIFCKKIGNNFLQFFFHNKINKIYKYLKKKFKNKINKKYIFLIMIWQVMSKNFTSVNYFYFSLFFLFVRRHSIFDSWKLIPLTCLQNLSI